MGLFTSGNSGWRREKLGTNQRVAGRTGYHEQCARAMEVARYTTTTDIVKILL